MAQVLNLKFLKYSSKWALMSHNALSDVVDINEALRKARAMQESHLVIDKVAAVGASLRPS